MLLLSRAKGISNHINLTDIRGWRGSEIKSEIENFVAIVNKNWATITFYNQLYKKSLDITSLGAKTKNTITRHNRSSILGGGGGDYILQLII